MRPAAFCPQELDTWVRILGQSPGQRAISKQGIAISKCLVQKPVMFREPRVRNIGPFWTLKNKDEISRSLPERSEEKGCVSTSFEMPQGCGGRREGTA